MDADNPLQMTFTANFMGQTDNGPMVLEGAVVISVADIVVTTDRAIVENGGTIRMRMVRRGRALHCFGARKERGADLFSDAKVNAEKLERSSLADDVGSRIAGSSSK